MVAHYLQQFVRGDSPTHLPEGQIPEPLAAVISKPTQLFNLNCFYAELIIVCFGLGIYSMMLMRYCMSKYKDGFWIKMTIVVSGTTLLANFSLLLYYLHYLLIRNYGLFKQYFEANFYGWFIFLDCGYGSDFTEQKAITSATTQTFFAYRAFRLTGRNWFILVVLLALIVTATGGATGTMIIFRSLPNELHALDCNIPFLIWLSAAMTVDVIITGAILYGLIKSKTGWAKTDKVIGRLVRMTLEAQIPPLALALALLIEYKIQPTSLLAATLTATQPFLYTIGFMYSLNSRVQLNSASDYTMNGETNGLTGHDTRTILVEVETSTYETRVEPRQPGINRRAVNSAGSQPAIIEEREWDSDDKTEAFDSVNGKLRVSPPTPTSEKSAHVM